MRRTPFRSGPRRAAARLFVSSGLVPVVWLGAVTGCLDTVNASRADTSPVLLQVSDSLEAEHFGAPYVEQPTPDSLRLLFRDPRRCDDRSPPLARFATQAAQQALTHFRPRPTGERPAPIRGVAVRFTRTHRFGALTWTTSLGAYSFNADTLRALPPPEPVHCNERLPSLLRPPPA